MPSTTWLSAVGGLGPLQYLLALGLTVAMLSRSRRTLTRRRAAP